MTVCLFVCLFEVHVFVCDYLFVRVCLFVLHVLCVGFFGCVNVCVFMDE